MRNRYSGALSGVVAAFPLTTVILLTAPARAEQLTPKECLGANEEGIALRAKHQLRRARDNFLRCAAPACPADIRDDCARRATADSFRQGILSEVTGSAAGFLLALQVSLFVATPGRIATSAALVVLPLLLVLITLGAVGWIHR